ncbi:MAG: hypothetical protein JOZ75_04865 [Candidatus Dormibacteraeota bacterium]|nr:hypothetical protein [Candidatus Dormibacteraeota bacterium]
MTAQRFKLAIGIAIVATLASLVGVFLNLSRPTAATAAAATSTPSPSPNPSKPHGGGPFFGHGGFGFAPAFGGKGTGTVTGISGGTLMLRTLTGTLTVNTTSSTTYTKEGKSIALGDIKVNDVLNVRPVRPSGTQTPSATPPTTITAQSIAVVLPTFFGRVDSVSGPTIFIVTGDGEMAYVVTNSSTTYTMNGSSASFSDVKAGDYVSASGTQTDIKHLTAGQVVISTNAHSGPGPAFGGPFHGRGGPKPSPSASGTAL